VTQSIYILYDPAINKDSVVFLYDDRAVIQNGLNAENLVRWASRTFYSGENPNLGDIIVSNKPGALIFVPGYTDMLFGLTLNTKVTDIIRSVFEGIAFYYYSIFMAGGMDQTTAQVFVWGSTFHVDSFCQQCAHIFNKKVSRIGGASPDILVALKKLLKTGITESPHLPKIIIEKSFKPDIEVHHAYEVAFHRYRSLCADMFRHLEKLSVS
jgi:sugar (pentulose or hexulose) kinase